MRILWKLLKVIIGLAIAIPLFIIVLVTTVGVLGTLLGLAILALKLACLAFAGYGLYRLGRFVFAPTPTATPAGVRELPEARDLYYDAAMRELDSELRR
jgi:hypothetical protein